MVSSGDTIAAIATAPGRGAVGILRISGPATGNIAISILGCLPSPRIATLRPFSDLNHRLLDHGIALFFVGPASYTGEDLLELQAHGGPAVMRGLLAAAYDAGARPARPGEFTQRAFLNGKIDLLQAESVATLIETASAQAASAAARACAGDFSTAVTGINHALKTLWAMLEASIDFAEETSVQTGPIEQAFGNLRHQLSGLLRDARAGARLNQGLDVAIVGRPNSGKSTLLNRLCRDDRAIVTDIPGTTRDVLSVDVDLSGLALRIHDTAGLRETADPIEQEGLRRARALLKRCDILLYVVALDDADQTEPAEVAAARELGLPVLTVANKRDLLATQPAETPAIDKVFISALTGEGLATLEQALLDLAGGQEILDAPFVARARHIEALERASAQLTQAQLENADGALELACEGLRLASRALEEMTGTYTTEDLLGDIFSRFCIGK